jgi:hypothetical protein
VGAEQKHVAANKDVYTQAQRILTAPQEWVLARRANPELSGPYAVGHAPLSEWGELASAARCPIRLVPLNQAVHLLAQIGEIYPPEPRLFESILSWTLYIQVA